MNTTAIDQHKQRHIARSARRLSCAGAVAILLTWAPASIAAAEDETAPESAQSQAAPSEQKSDADKLRYPDETLCAEAAAGELSDETLDAVGCGLSARFADATPAVKQRAEGVEGVDALLALHVQSRNMIPYDDQLLPGLTRMLADRT